MKAILEFNLPEEQVEHRQAVDAPRYHAALWDITQGIRTWRKHGHSFMSSDEALDKVHEMIWESIKDNGVDLD